MITFPKVNSAISLSAVFLFCGYLLTLGCGHPTQDSNGNGLPNTGGADTLQRNDAEKTGIWEAPDTASISKDEHGELIRYGRDLIVNTARYLGPKGTVRKISNGMNCQNCHLHAGTQLWANSFSAVYANYPKRRARSGTIETLDRRINDCMERSLNGEKLDSSSHEMQAMVAYINWVGQQMPKDSTPVGASVEAVPYLERAADPVKGKVAFEKHCISCHHDDGGPTINVDGVSYLFPPLWGPHSYTKAAGMYRLSRLAGFIKSNMPLERTSHDHPKLTDEEAWDIAAFVNSMPRPDKKFKGDWPDISKKPVDHPFGPYADNFTESQHKYGPFQPILDAAKKK
jgi:thiosulfate dehydrogenase